MVVGIVRCGDGGSEGVFGEEDGNFVNKIGWLGVGFVVERLSLYV